MPRPNNYVGAEGSYGRVTGLGNMPCSSIVLPPGFVGPVDCDPTDGGPTYPVGQNQISQIWGYLNDVADAQSAPSPPSIGFMDMLRVYWPFLAVGVAAILLVKDRR
jgi:hypothetical protein